MNYHLDNRCLHGRILHGWGTRLRVKRYLIFSLDLSDPQIRELYRDGARSVGCEIEFFASSADYSSHVERTGDFWLVDSPAAALELNRVEPRFERLILIGLRDQSGEVISEDVRLSADNRALLEELAAHNVSIEIRRFPENDGKTLTGTES
ncbi:MAG: PTS sugar transporter subunit IIB [bacterium]|nr:PTS sugar transporter subunit IIB [bacterium]